MEDAASWGGNDMRDFINTVLHWAHTKPTNDVSVNPDLGPDGECIVCDYPFGNMRHVCLAPYLIAS